MRLRDGRARADGVGGGLCGRRLLLSGGGWFGFGWVVVGFKAGFKGNSLEVHLNQTIRGVGWVRMSVWVKFRDSEQTITTSAAGWSPYMVMESKGIPQKKFLSIQV